MRRWDSLLDRYIKVCEARGLAESTIDLRSRELTRFGNWLRRRRPKPSLEEVDSELLVGYLGMRAAFRSRATAYRAVSELRCMGEFLVDEGIWNKNPLRWLRGPKMDQRRRLPRRISKGHMKGMWEAAQRRPGEHDRYQAVCVLAIIYGTGIRSGELQRLDLGAWDPEGATLRVDGRKTGEARSVAVSEGVWRCIEACLPRRHNQLEKTGHIGEEALLVNRKGERLNNNNLRALLRRLAISADVPFVTMHQFRHSCASDLLEAGVTLPEVQRILGHASIQSTVRYVSVADPCRAKAMEKHPVNGFLTQGIEEVRP